ncbi:AAA family ATPase [Ectobacillus ponti]|uniref:ATP-binding protein n=1 Tax=Ectobacillus ponti TaxID=2961894 RepID=A0AA42BPY2_9BACI|nr:AAA family ATPase [Ectobacillus ponti]MCP8969700.1 ATP-binding protein [Ectobacillus ponti]
MFNITKARREKLKAVVGFIGCSGAGKTAGALLVAYGMMREAYPEATEEEVWEKIGVIDTEHGRAKLYASSDFDGTRIGQFLHIDFSPPYSTDRYDMAVQAMKRAGAEVIIVDSLSHNWQGEGGIVETHGQMSGNSFQNWGKLVPETTKLVKTLTRNNVHILATLRTKQEYVVEPDASGKMAPRKVGTKPVQKDEMEYEFMLNFQIAIDHVAETSKDNTRMFEGNPAKLTPDVGRKLYQWLELGIDVRAEEQAKQAAEEAERLALIQQVRDIAASSADMKKKVEEFEFKANMKLDQFSAKLAKVAIERLQASSN